MGLDYQQTFWCHHVEDIFSFTMNYFLARLTHWITRNWFFKDLRVILDVARFSFFKFNFNVKIWFYKANLSDEFLYQNRACLIVHKMSHFNKNACSSRLWIFRLLINWDQSHNIFTGSIAGVDLEWLFLVHSLQIFFPNISFETYNNIPLYVITCLELMKVFFWGF